ncbi:MAG: hypothetical protein R3Y64_08320, partial [Peptostreptococcaceae bacterium]
IKNSYIDAILDKENFLKFRYREAYLILDMMKEDKHSYVRVKEKISEVKKERRLKSSLMFTAFDEVLTDEQELQIKYTLHLGFDNVNYFKGKSGRAYNSDQLKQIRLGLIDKVDVSKYLDENMHAHQMYYIRLALKSGKINIDSLELDDILYNTLEVSFCDGQFFLDREPLTAEGLDEVLIGEFAGIDTSLYRQAKSYKPLADGTSGRFIVEHSLMKEIRLCIMEGLDIKSLQDEDGTFLTSYKDTCLFRRVVSEVNRRYFKPEAIDYGRCITTPYSAGFRLNSIKGVEKLYLSSYLSNHQNLEELECQIDEEFNNFKEHSIHVNSNSTQLKAILDCYENEKIKNDPNYTCSNYEEKLANEIDEDILSITDKRILNEKSEDDLYHELYDRGEEVIFSFPVIKNISTNNILDNGASKPINSALKEIYEIRNIAPPSPKKSNYLDCDKDMFSLDDDIEADSLENDANLKDLDLDNTYLNLDENKDMSLEGIDLDLAFSDEELISGVRVDYNPDDVIDLFSGELK